MKISYLLLGMKSLMTYINVLPKELRNELDLYKNNLLHSITDKIFKAFPIISPSGNSDGLLEYMFDVCPCLKTIKIDVVMSKSPKGYSLGTMKLRSTQVITFEILQEIVNNYSDFHADLKYYSGNMKELQALVSEINVLLANDGFKECIIK